MLLQPCSWEEMKCKTKILHLMILLQGVHQVLSYRPRCLDLCSPKISLVLSASARCLLKNKLLVGSSRAVWVSFCQRFVVRFQNFKLLTSSAGNQVGGKSPCQKLTVWYGKFRKYCCLLDEFVTSSFWFCFSIWNILI